LKAPGCGAAEAEPPQRGTLEQIMQEKTASLHSRLLKHKRNLFFLICNAFSQFEKY